MKKLDVLTCFLKSIGEKITCIPENVLNKNTRNTNYGKDDIPYSVLLSIINHYGYSLKFKLVPSEKSSLMPLKEKREIAAVRLNGLAEYIGTFFPRMKDFADAVGFSRTTILHWLQVDNVQLSKLF